MTIMPEFVELAMRPADPLRKNEQPTEFQP